MIKKVVLYRLLKAYVRAGCFFYFHKLIVKGRDNIPRSGPVLFLANHQNALLDALVFAVTVPRYSHFIARADVFKNRFIGCLLSQINIRPVYRFRDGLKTVTNNYETFQWASAILLKDGCLLFFPEGNHSLLRRVRPLSKGFTRIIDEVFKKNPNLPLQVVPVGLNYTNHTGFRGSVSICYGQPVSASPYRNNLPALRSLMEQQLKTLTTHIDDEAAYAELIKKLEATRPDHLDPLATNELIRSIERGNPVPHHNARHRPRARFMLLPVYLLTALLNALPLVVWPQVKKRITDPVFIGTFRFALGITLVPAWYVVLIGAAYRFAGPVTGLLGAVVCAGSLPVYQACRKFIF